MISALDLFNSVPDLLPTLCRVPNNELKISFIIKSLKDVLSLGSTCKDYYSWINQEQLCSTLIKMFELDNPLFGPLNFYHKSWNGFLARQFCSLSAWHIKPRITNETSRGVNLGKAFLTDAGILLFDLEAHPIQFYLLEKNPKIEYLEIPKDKQGETEFSPHVAISKDYIVFNLDNGEVHVFSRSEKQYLYSFPIECCDILQLEINNDILFVRVHIGSNIQRLSRFNLVTKEESEEIFLYDVEHSDVFIPSYQFHPLCIGEKYFACAGRKNKIMLHSLEDSKLYVGNPFEDLSQEAIGSEESILDNELVPPQIFDIKADGNGFIIVGENESSNLSVSKVEIIDGKFCSKFLAEEIRLKLDENEISIRDINEIYYFSGRLFYTCEEFIYNSDSSNNSWNEVINSYDLNTHETCRLVTLPGRETEDPFAPCLLKRGSELFYIIMGVNDDPGISHLIKIDYRPLNIQFADVNRPPD